MIREKSLEELILLPEADAVRSFFDSGNHRSLFRYLALCAAATVFTSPLLAHRRGSGWLVLSLVNLVLILVLYRLRDRPVFSRSFRPFLLSYIALQALIWKAMTFHPEGGTDPLDFALPWSLVLFRLPDGLLALPLAVFWLWSVGRNVAESAFTDVRFDIGLLIGQTTVSLIVFALVRHRTRRQRFDFLVRWRREHHRNREQQRMQEELDDARKIQLSMLPRHDPRLDWLEIAGISIPASEVGGDYYDYFTLGDRRQAIAVGDVAGHGVASGLLLSGIRSCLYLLRDSPLAPVEILARLDPMVRETTGRRMFVTLLYAVFDHGARTLTFSAAGHPPLLCRRAATGAIEEHALEALPLGTGLGSRLREMTLSYEPGDVFLLYTDGIAETLSSRGDLYGSERLHRCLRSVSEDLSAKEIRDLVLGDVWSFKADGQQIDDITIVVAKIRSEGFRRLDP